VSGASNAIVLATTVPDPPVIGSATPGISSASVSFAPPANDGGSPITQFDATCVSSNGGGAGAASGTTSPILVTSLSGGKSYTCAVTATNAVGTSAASAASNTTSPSITVPDPPTIGTVTLGDSSLTVSFSPPLNNGGSAITNYTVNCTS